MQLIRVIQLAHARCTAIEFSLIVVRLYRTVQGIFCGCTPIGLAVGRSRGCGRTII